MYNNAHFTNAAKGSLMTPDRVTQIADKAEARAGQEPKIGRPSDYTEAMASHICAEMSAGRSLRSICEDTGIHR